MRINILAKVDPNPELQGLWMKFGKLDHLKLATKSKVDSSFREARKTVW